MRLRLSGILMVSSALYLVTILGLYPSVRAPIVTSFKKIVRSGTDVALLKPKRCSSDLSSYQEVTVSWYGSDFHGKMAANGSPYNMYALTAAHTDKNMLGKRVTFCNAENGRKTTVVITDTGPWDPKNIPKENWKRKLRKYLTPHPEREFDLSFAAASRLGIVEKGVAQVYYKEAD